MTIKSILITLLCLPVFASAQGAKGTYFIQGQITGINKPQAVKAYLRIYRTTATDDSATIKNGCFKFKGTIAEPNIASISLKLKVKGKDTTQMFNFFVEKGTAKLVFNVDSSIRLATPGSLLNQQMQAFDNTTAAITKKTNTLLKDYFNLEDRKADSTQDQAFIIREMGRVSDRLDSLDVLQHHAEEVFITAHPASFFSLFLLSESQRHGLSYEKTQFLFAKLNPGIRNMALGKILKATLIRESAFAIGKKLPDFSQPDTCGKPLSLKSFRGKYVLVDFWASWCNPCRAENPNVKKAYQQYHRYNFDVLGVSSDFQKASWLKAIKADGLVWANVIDNKGKIAKLLNIKAIPSNFLLDPTGKILARNLRGNELNKVLAAVLHQ